jgi:hypothetical protein
MGKVCTLLGVMKLMKCTCFVVIFWEMECMYTLCLIEELFLNLKLMYFVILSASQVLLTSVGQTGET